MNMLEKPQKSSLFRCPATKRGGGELVKAGAVRKKRKVIWSSKKNVATKLPKLP